MRRTPPLTKLADTTSGMRRILQRGIPLNEYIEHAVRCGTYKSPGEKPEAVEPRYRKGHRFYPKEYEILRLNPPLPTPARMPKSYYRKLAREEQDPIEQSREQLMQSYLNRHNRNNSITTAGFDGDSPLKTDDYYRKLLGMPAPSTSSVMGQKSSILNKAYVVACRQEELMRTQGKSAEESLELVEELLREAEKTQAKHSREVQKAVHEWREQQQEQQKKDKSSARGDQEEEETPSGNPMHNNTTPPPHTVPSILHSKPRTVSGIAIWSQRLKVIPYQQWTVGASVALDHFIARSILEIPEETWDAILEGTDPSLTSMGRDIVTVRRSLFPETNMQEDDDDVEEAVVDDNDDALTGSNQKREKSIDELLASLGGLDDDGSSDLWKTDDTEDEEGEEYNDEDKVIAKLRQELQNWRQRHWEEEPYEDWDAPLQEEFQTWLQGYVKVVLPEVTSDTVDYNESREALLSVPPHDDAENFWENIRDETTAEAFLQSCTTSTTKNPKLDTFLNTLSTEEQVRRLVNMSTLRPMMDLDGIKPKTRLAFLERHADKLIQGVELEHIVRDDVEGPITAEQLVDWGYAVMKASTTTKKKRQQKKMNPEDLLVVESDQRFRLEKMPYDDHAIKKSYFIAWNIHKSARARYEEHLFRTGGLGLRYGDDTTTTKKK
mmetsp:Transcript_5580/g.8082  ORF Transcript_5580/g.8082 Transcript_5580/m.8082 type:complete len:664 (+) Transcript_5580:186-2177(+)|eukprot:CAMPEP_0194227666 /NCGR_PEP_ID=MMETSP0156-20130528/42975_1 /TAXON_ID=33649 /ORGANISM="Thalassionema nitzschioides, Strain L26-B" /LENGTH=663 /DNA_ID=CAMNT_0038960157 /DNA_START=130 /DNA_END=2121 /DNA_ORIENTATION=-